jgi:hypothetical protein
VSEWLPSLAAAIHAKPPYRLPAFVGRLLGGEATVVALTEIRGASNAKARRELSWELVYPSWRDGFRAGLGSGARVTARAAMPGGFRSERLAVRDG